MKRANVYKWLARGDIRSVKIGKRRLIDVGQGLGWLDSLPTAPLRSKTTA
jgi:hypothetical protein